MTKTRKNHSWKNEKPGYHQRTVMQKRCGKKCFLGSFSGKNTRRRASFPICKKNTCKVSRAGVLAAYKRAREYSSKGRKYQIVAAKARRILDS